MIDQADVLTPRATTSILVVEDDEPIQLLLRDILSSAHFAPVVVSTGTQALEQLEQRDFDLMILDLMLPDMDGYEVCQRVRESSHSSLPIIMLSALKQQQRIVKGLSLGADDYVTKPFFPDELLARIQRLLRQRQEELTLVNENGALRNMLQLAQRELHSAQQESQTESILRRELLHNVSTHMQSLCAIIEAELRRLPPGQEREAVQRVRSRVRGAALVYQVSESLQQDPVRIDEVISITASALKTIYRPWKRITMTITGEPTELPASIASPLAMVVNELITNCFKHAFPENRFGTITVTHRRDDFAFYLEVIDNGVGSQPARPKHGSGCATIRQIIDSLSGTIEWDSGPDGTRAALSVPVPGGSRGRAA
jgi:DNA-binding response OmpR family regulator